MTTDCPRCGTPGGHEACPACHAEYLEHPLPAQRCKRCVECGEVKPVNQFGSKPGRPGWLSRCKPCYSARTSRLASERRRTDPDFLERERNRERKPTPAAAQARAEQAVRRKIRGTPEWARYRLQIAVRRGQVTKPEACEACGAIPPRHRLHGDHWHGDYTNRPFEVKWLCSLCHAANHRTVNNSDLAQGAEHPAGGYPVESHPRGSSATPYKAGRDGRGGAYPTGDVAR